MLSYKSPLNRDLYLLKCIVLHQLFSGAALLGDAFFMFCWNHRRTVAINIIVSSTNWHIYNMVVQSRWWCSSGCMIRIYCGSAVAELSHYYELNHSNKTESDQFYSFLSVSLMWLMLWKNYTKLLLLFYDVRDWDDCWLLVKHFQNNGQ